MAGEPDITPPADRADPVPPDIVPLAELARIIATDVGLKQQLMRHALGHTRNAADAEDLFQDTLTKAFDPDIYVWDRNNYPTVHLYLGSVMNGCARNRLRSSYMARREDLDEQNPPQVSAPADRPDRQLEMAARHRKREDMEKEVRARLHGKTLALGILDELAKKAQGNVSLAQKLNCTLKQILAAKQMIRDYAAEIVAERASEPGTA